MSKKSKGSHRSMLTFVVLFVMASCLFTFYKLKGSELMANAGNLLAAVSATSSTSTPVISSVVSATPGGWAKLRGKNLSTNVTIVGATYPVLSPKVTSDSARVDFKIDPREIPGSYSVYVTNASVKSNTMPFVVVGPQPGSVADLSATLAPSSPLSGKYAISPAGGAETNLPIASYRLKSSVQDSTINSLTFRIGTTPALGSNLGSSMRNFKLSDGVNNYSASSLSNGNVTFSNLRLSMSKDIAKDFVLSADIAASSSSFYATTYLDVSRIVAVDSNYNTPTYGGAILSGVTTDIRGGTLNFVSQSQLTFSGAPSGAPTLIPNGQLPSVKGTQTYILTLNNIGNLPLYLSKNDKVLFSVSTNPAGNASSSISILMYPVPIAGDTSGAYMIPAGGSRSLSVTNIVGKSSKISVKDTINVTAINYGATAANPTGMSIKSGLSVLSSAIIW